MRQFTYIAPNNLLKKDIKNDDLFTGEKILYKCEDIKYEDK